MGKEYLETVIVPNPSAHAGAKRPRLAEDPGCLGQSTGANIPLQGFGTCRWSN